MNRKGMPKTLSLLAAVVYLGQALLGPGIAWAEEGTPANSKPVAQDVAQDGEPAQPQPQEEPEAPAPSLMEDTGLSLLSGRGYDPTVTLKVMDQQHPDLTSDAKIAVREMINRIGYEGQGPDRKPLFDGTHGVVVALDANGNAVLVTGAPDLPRAKLRETVEASDRQFLDLAGNVFLISAKGYGFPEEFFASEAQADAGPEAPAEINREPDVRWGVSAVDLWTQASQNSGNGASQPLEPPVSGLPSADGVLADQAPAAAGDPAREDVLVPSDGGANPFDANQGGALSPAPDVLRARGQDVMRGQASADTLAPSDPPPMEVNTLLEQALGEENPQEERAPLPEGAADVPRASDAQPAMPSFADVVDAAPDNPRARPAPVSPQLDRFAAFLFSQLDLLEKAVKENRLSYGPLMKAYGARVLAQDGDLAPVVEALLSPLAYDATVFETRYRAAHSLMALMRNPVESTAEGTALLAVAFANEVSAGIYNDALVDQVNTLALLADPPLTRVGVGQGPRSNGKTWLGAGAHLIGNPAYGRWEQVPPPEDFSGDPQEREAQSFMAVVDQISRDQSQAQSLSADYDPTRSEGRFTAIVESALDPDNIRLFQFFVWKWNEPFSNYPDLFRPDVDFVYWYFDRPWSYRLDYGRALFGLSNEMAAYEAMTALAADRLETVGGIRDLRPSEHFTKVAAPNHAISAHTADAVRAGDAFIEGLTKVLLARAARQAAEASGAAEDRQAGGSVVALRAAATETSPALQQAPPAPSGVGASQPVTAAGDLAASGEGATAVSGLFDPAVQPAPAQQDNAADRAMDTGAGAAAFLSPAVQPAPGDVGGIGAEGTTINGGSVGMDGGSAALGDGTAGATGALSGDGSAGGQVFDDGGVATQGFDAGGALGPGAGVDPGAGPDAGANADLTVDDGTDVDPNRDAGFDPGGAPGGTGADAAALGTLDGGQRQSFDSGDGFAPGGPDDPDNAITGAADLGPQDTSNAALIIPPLTLDGVPLEPQVAPVEGTAGGPPAAAGGFGQNSDDPNADAAATAPADAGQAGRTETAAADDGFINALDPNDGDDGTADGGGRVAVGPNGDDDADGDGSTVPAGDGVTVAAAQRAGDGAGAQPGSLPQLMIPLPPPTQAEQEQNAALGTRLTDLIAAIRSVHTEGVFGEAGASLVPALVQANAVPPAYDVTGNQLRDPVAGQISLISRQDRFELSMAALPAQACVHVIRMLGAMVAEGDAGIVTIATQTVSLDKARQDLPADEQSLTQACPAGGTDVVLTVY